MRMKRSRMKRSRMKRSRMITGIWSRLIEEMRV